MFQIQGCPARAVALVRFHGDLSEADFVGLIGLAASAGVAWNYIFDFTAVERADLAADYVAKLGELPQLFTDRQRICVVPQADLRLVRLFAAYQTSKGWRPPENRRLAGGCLRPPRRAGFRLHAVHRHTPSYFTRWGALTQEDLCFDLGSRPAPSALLQLALSSGEPAPA